MKVFPSLKMLFAPRKAEFTKRLIATRRASAQNNVLAGIATAGSREYHLRKRGLESIEYSATPEATIVNILELYWQPHIANFYTKSSLYGNAYDMSMGTSEVDRSAFAKRRVNDLAGHLEYLLTGRPDAEMHLPEFNTFIEYLRYRIQVEHPKNVYIKSEDGFTDEFFSYAIEESRFVFNRK